MPRRLRREKSLHTAPEVKRLSGVSQRAWLKQLPPESNQRQKLEHAALLPMLTLDGGIVSLRRQAAADGPCGTISRPFFRKSRYPLSFAGWGRSPTPQLTA